jgi:hypothetical protein
MPDMPMPPMPMKWILPISVPIAFMPAPPCRRGPGGLGTDQQRRLAGDPLDQVSEVAGRVRAPNRQRAFGGVAECLRSPNDPPRLVYCGITRAPPALAISRALAV